MVFEGVFAWFLLTIGGVPMAGLLGLVTGVLAFIPNIGAITSGVLMIAVGFSASASQGVWCIVVYFLVHNIDAYVVVPYVARRTVDLAPAVLLAMQLLMGALFGILGILFADPILATLKVVLVDLSHRQAEREEEGPAVVAGDGAIAGAPAVAAAGPASAASAASSPRRRGIPRRPLDYCFRRLLPEKATGPPQESDGSLCRSSFATITSSRPCARSRRSCSARASIAR
jgi:hypothetical protein